MFEFDNIFNGALVLPCIIKAEKILASSLLFSDLEFRNLSYKV